MGWIVELNRRFLKKNKNNRIRTNIRIHGSRQTATHDRRIKQLVPLLLCCASPRRSSLAGENNHRYLLDFALSMFFVSQNQRHSSNELLYVAKIYWRNFIPDELKKLLDNRFVTVWIRKKGHTREKIEQARFRWQIFMTYYSASFTYHSFNLIL